MEERKVNLGKEILNIRSLLKLRREEFAKITSMSVDEIKDLEENHIEATMVQRFKICIGLERLLKYHREKYPLIILNQILYVIGDVSPFNTIEEFEEVSLMFQTINNNIEDFRETYQEHHRR